MDDNPNTSAPLFANPRLLAFDPDGEIPVACAILKVTEDEATGRPIDVRYAYVSRRYANALGREVEGLVGHSHTEVLGLDKSTWLDQCHRAAMGGETVNGFMYSPLVRDWVCYNLAPSSAAGHCSYTLIPVTIDEREREKLMSSVDVRTSRFISDMLVALSAEQGYHAAMEGMLQMLSQVIHASRICVFESAGQHTRLTFERCAPGVQPQQQRVFDLPRKMLTHWFKTIAKDPVLLIPNIDALKRFSEPLYRWCLATGSKSLMAAPFFIDGEIVGFLGAYNYQIDQTIDLKRLFSAVSSFIAARIDNRRLIDDLKWAGDHDALTGLLNRRGARRGINEHFGTTPGGPFVLALIDMDDFKQINDTYGHDAGDVALETMARDLSEGFPSEAILSRNGGDEFLVFLWGEAAARARELIAAFSARELSFEFEGKRHAMTVSIGYAVYPLQAGDATALYSIADDALYAVKRAGKAGFGQYEPA